MNREVYDASADCREVLTLWAQAAASAPSTTTDNDNGNGDVNADDISNANGTVNGNDRVHGGFEAAAGGIARAMLCNLPVGSEFALALVDESAGVMLLARDPLGVKPLYLAGPHSCFLFTST